MVSILFESLRKSRPFADVIITWLLKARLFCRKPRLSWSSPSSRPSRGCWSIAGPSRLSSRLLTILFCHSFGRSSSSCISTAQDRSMGMVSSVVGNRFLPLPCSAALCSHTVTWEWESFPGSEPPSFPVSHLLDWTFSEFRVSWGSSRFIIPHTQFGEDNTLKLFGVYQRASGVPHWGCLCGHGGACSKGPMLLVCVC